jgi:FkbM family methyltransferase
LHNLNSSFSNITNIDFFYKVFTKSYLYNGGFKKSALDVRLNIGSYGFKEKLLKFKPVQEYWLRKNIMSPFMQNFSKFDFAKDIIENEHKYRELYELFTDETSRQTLIAVLLYKLTQNREYINKISRSFIDQYFEPELIKYKNSGEVFVDCGGYIGDTATSFYRLKIPVKKYYFIEPDPSNYEIAKTALAEFEDIVCCQCATGKTKGEIYFAGHGAGAHVSQNGNFKIPVEAIDDLIKEPVTFIKMDIEGAESDTLEGAKKQIVNNKPKLAVCAYHKPDDAWKLAFQIKELRPDYKLYFRLYQSSYCEAVIYAI